MLPPNILTFLAALSENNNREWFEAHKAEYKALRQPFAALMNELAQQIAHFDPEIQTRLVDPKTVKVFRINRDVRFSKNKDPYKTSFSGAIAAGQSPTQPAYYLSVEPGHVLAGVGLYMPASKVLAAIREKIDETPKPLESVLASKAFRSVFPNGIDTDLKLKTAPKGYPKDHPSIHLLRLKSFTALRRFADGDLCQDSFVSELMAGYEAGYGLVCYLREATAGLLLDDC